MAIEGYPEILRFGGIDRSADGLCAVMEDVDANSLAPGATDRFQEPRIVDGEQVALGRARLKASPRWNAACRNLGQVMIGLVVGESYDSPNGARPFLAPEDLGRALDFGLEVARFAIGDISRLDPILVLFDLEPGNSDPGDAGRDDSVALRRLQQDDEPSAMLLLVGSIAVKNRPRLEGGRIIRRLREDLVDSQHVETLALLARTVLDANDSRLGNVAYGTTGEALLLALRVAGSLDEGVPCLVRYPVEALARFEWKQFAVHLYILSPSDCGQAKADQDHRPGRRGQLEDNQVRPPGQGEGGIGRHVQCVAEVVSHRIDRPEGVELGRVEQ